jgi:hypothetical protein
VPSHCFNNVSFAFLIIFLLSQLIFFSLYRPLSELDRVSACVAVPGAAASIDKYRVSAEVLKVLKSLKFIFLNLRP